MCWVVLCARLGSEKKEIPSWGVSTPSKVKADGTGGNSVSQENGTPYKPGRSGAAQLPFLPAFM